ncbi:hypothetical protein BO221_09735 [Archangium sp. Cb G35]|uniref:helix-turn-helix domain-containing protein n=1 Tax=Archangium sp. Cb G35 TaxID=1920190 RepID=UPI000937AD5F|nr:helix-turn-helix domain-containing protein [Archangium sp. Cb G35]OJT26094.1 hypothetical protein BO221_09735 [Archangium sp. Cb G35]
MQPEDGTIAQGPWWRRVGVAGALGLPVLFSARSLTFGDGALRFFAENWLYLAAPHGVAFLAHKFVPFVRSIFLTPALLAVSGVLLFFQCWTWWFVPLREGPLAWLLYPPTCAAVLFFHVIEAHAGEPISLADIVAAAGVPERSLRAAFIAARGIPPVAFLRRRRFEIARQTLLTGAPGTAVAGVVASLGCLFTNHFAAADARPALRRT